MYMNCLTSKLPHSTISEMADWSMVVQLIIYMYICKVSVCFRRAGELVYVCAFERSHKVMKWQSARWKGHKAAST